MSLSRRISAVAAGVALALTLSACAGEPEPDFTAEPMPGGALPADVVAQLEEAVTHAMTATGSTGAIVGVWVPWSGAWVSALGTHEPGGAAVTVDDSFRIGDTTRMMTCDLLHALDAEGVLDKDAPVSDYVSATPDLNDVTLLDLCNGTAGIGAFEPDLRGIWMENPERVWSPLEMAAFGLGKARSETKTTYRESDAGYVLLGVAFERATGIAASDLLAQYVTTPLGLASPVLPSPEPAEPAGSPLRGSYLPTVDGAYDCTAPIDITRQSSSLGFTDAGAVSTITELGQYVRASAAGKVAGGAERWADPLPLSANAEQWRQATGGAQLVGPLIGTYSAVPGYITAAFSDPATGFTIAVVLNDSTAGAGMGAYLAWELAAIASKAPAAEGQTLPEFALPFTAETFHTAIAERAITCATPPAPEGETDGESG